jgi:hypothetical protein
MTVMTQKERNFWKKYFAKEEKRAARARVLFLKTYGEQGYRDIAEYWKDVDPMEFQREARGN